jgi:hypothetical protein
MARRYDDNDDDDDDYKPRFRRLAKKPVHSHTWDDEDDEEEEDDGDEHDPRDELIDVLESIDDARESLDNYQLTLSYLFARHPDLKLQWRKFLQVGGLTADDFRKFLRGELRPRIVRQRKHLRLVSNRKVTPLSFNNNSGGEAA